MNLQGGNMSEKLITYQWNGVDRHDTPVETEVPRHVYTVLELYHTLGELILKDEYYANLPVHVLDMSTDGFIDPGVVAEGLLTDVETDMFDEKQGMVLDLVSWPAKKG